MAINRRQALIGAGAASSLGLPLIGCGPKASASEIEIVMTQGLSGLILQEMAVAKGYFEEFNVVPKILTVSDGTKCVAALLSGAAKICIWSGFNQVVPAIERGGQIKILAGALNLPSLAVYTTRPDIRSVKDLRGRSIGIGAPGSVLHQMMVLMLKKEGVDPSEVTFRNVGSITDILKATISGTIDAGPSDVDVFDHQQQLGIHALPDGLLWSEIPEYTNQGTYASDAAIRDQRDMLVRVLAAYGKVYRYVCAPDSWETFIAAREKVTGKKDTGEGRTQWNWIQKYQPYAKDLLLGPERINFVQNLNVEFGVQKTVLPIAQVADMSLAQEALKLMG